MPVWGAFGRWNQRRHRGGSVVVAVALAALAAAVPIGDPIVARADAARPWLDQDASATARADELLGAMTTNDKLQLIDGAPITSGAPAGFVGYIPGMPTLGVPPLYFANGPLGVGDGTTGVTELPSGISDAATFDPALVKAIGEVEGEEQSAKGHDVSLGPDLDILRVPNAGRAFESFGEDPYLASSLASADVSGVQSAGVIAVAKHFVAGTQETNRHSIDTVVSQRALAEIYEPPFHSAATAGVGAVMCSYNKVDGAYSCQNASTLADTLEQAWRFRGFVVSDWGATHSTTSAAEAGLDMEMPGGTPETAYFGTAMQTALDDGSVSMSTVDNMARRILWAMFSAGLFDRSLPDPAAVSQTDVSTPAHRAVALRGAEEGAVLLKNSGGLLPLEPASDGSVAVIGAPAGAAAVYGGGGSSYVEPTDPVSPISGITQRAAAANVTVTAVPGDSDLASLAQVPPDLFTPTQGTGDGWSATYYPTSDFSGASSITENVDSLDVSSPPASVAGDTSWSVTYSATLTSPTATTDEFELTAGARAALWINGKVTARYSPQSGSPATALVTLPAKTPTSFELLVVGGTGPVVDLTWAPSEDQLWSAAATAAASADVAVVFANNYSHEGADLSTLELPGDQDRLIEAVARANPHTIVVLNTSSAVLMPWLPNVGAVLEMWYPGQEYGTAVAALLFGDVDPSGHTPVTFPDSAAQGVAAGANVFSPSSQYPGTDGDVDLAEGLDVGYRYYDTHEQTPLFPFGYGLSYTTFDYRDPRVTLLRAGGARVSVTVRNTGTRSGATIVQLYLTDPSSAGEPPYQLKGFKRAALDAGSEQRVTFTIDRTDMSCYRSGHWVLAHGIYRANIGSSERDAHLSVAWPVD